MQHQIIGLRDYIAKNGKPKKRHAFFEEKWVSHDIKEIFKNPETFVSKIKPEERFNIYFTVAKCAGEREFGSQKYMPFDIDNVDTTRASETVSCALSALGLKWENTLSLCSGNGVQFFVELDEEFSDPNFFDDNREHYKHCCLRIASALKKAKLPGEPDSSVFSLARLMRMPNTLNRKPNKPEVKSYVLQDNSVPVPFKLEAAAGVPTVARDEVIVKWPPPDTKAVLDGCLNLRMLLEAPESVSEPLWYAAASVIGHLGGTPAEGRKIWHEYSSKYSKYDPKEAEMKLDQAMAASSVRTCKNFSTLPGAKCAECRFFKTKKSPIMIHGENYIKTKELGFHDIIYTVDGKIQTTKPNYNDLHKWFEQQNPYVVNMKAGSIFRHKETHYEPLEKLAVLNFAEKWMKPCTSQKAQEFAQKVYRNCLVDAEWFDKSTLGRMNFLNGVLDVATLEFTPGHSKDHGFMHVLPYNYDSTEDAPRFRRFLEEVTCGDKELEKMLLEFGGYCLSNDDYWEHKCLVLLGKGRNGKSAFFETLMAVAENGFSTIAMKKIEDPQYAADLEGRLFNVSEESSTAVFRETENLKALTSGGHVQVKTVYQKPYKIKNRAKMVFACNELPPSADTTDGFFERFAIVPFNAKFTRETRDPYLIKKLKAERAGILNMLLAAYREMVARGGLFQAQASIEALKTYRAMTSPIEGWIEDVLEVMPTFTENDYVVVNDVYAEYVQFCESGGHKPMQKDRLMEKVYSNNPVIKDRRDRRKINGLSTRLIDGIKLTKGQY